MPHEQVIYVGDGVWDLIACRSLGIPFIGVGERIAALAELGARQVLPDLEPRAFLEVVNIIRSSL